MKTVTIGSNAGNDVVLTHPVSGSEAIHVCQLGDKVDKYKIPPALKGICGYNLGITSIDSVYGRMKIYTIISKITPLPVTTCKKYYSTHPIQEKMLLDFTQFIDKTTNTVSLGNMVISLMHGVSKSYTNEITVKYTINRTINVPAFEPSSGKELIQSFGNLRQENIFLYSQKALVNNININNLIQL